MFRRAYDERKGLPAGGRGTQNLGEQKMRDAKNATCSELGDENASCSKHRGSLNSRGSGVLHMPGACRSVRGEL